MQSFEFKPEPAGRVLWPLGVATVIVTYAVSSEFDLNYAGSVILEYPDSLYACLALALISTPL